MLSVTPSYSCTPSLCFVGGLHIPLPITYSPWREEITEGLCLPPWGTHMAGLLRVRLGAITPPVGKSSSCISHSCVSYVANYPPPSTRTLGHPEALAPHVSVPLVVSCEIGPASFHFACPHTRRPPAPISPFLPCPFTRPLPPSLFFLSSLPSPH